MKPSEKLYMMYAMMGMMGTIPLSSSFDDKREKFTPEYIAELKRINEKNRKIRLLNKGLKEWDFEGIKVIALNYNNAVRKAKKIKELINQIQ